MRVRLKAVGNPDFPRGHPHREVSIPTTYVEVESLEEASRICREYIVENDLGGGNWAGGQVYDQNGEKIAQVSYNGRVWPAGGNQ